MALFDGDIERLTSRRLLSLTRRNASAEEDALPADDGARNVLFPGEEAAVSFGDVTDTGRLLSDALERESRRYPRSLALQQ